MTKEDMVTIIKAWESFNNLDSLVMKMSGGAGIDFYEFKAIWDIPAIVKRNSKYCQYQSDEMSKEFLSVLNNKKLSAEEKYELLV